MGGVHLLENRARIGMLVCQNRSAQCSDDRLVIRSSTRKQPHRHSREAVQRRYRLTLEGLATEGSYESWELGQVRQPLWVEPTLDSIGDDGRHQCCDQFGLAGLACRFDRQRTHARNPKSETTSN
jgi:hypothetical protein